MATYLHPGVYVEETGASTVNNVEMGKFLQRIPSEHTWDDLSVSGNILDELKRLVVKIQSAKGGAALFTGSSGTGKTMSAEVVAGALDYDLYRIDLASVVSKYIGETEKNLSGVFEYSKTLDAILFFDEADALFGKRSSVKDAHDRYANLDTSYFLQRIEDYNGIVILTGNLRADFDEAFLRRMDWSIEFTPPEPEPLQPWWRRLLRWLGVTSSGK